MSPQLQPTNQFPPESVTSHFSYTHLPFLLPLFSPAPHQFHVLHIPILYDFAAQHLTCFFKPVIASSSCSSLVFALLLSPSISLIISVLSGDLFSPNPPTPSQSSSLSSPIRYIGCVFMGTGGRLRWSVLSYSLFWCAGIDRDRGRRTGSLGEERTVNKLRWGQE